MIYINRIDEKNRFLGFNAYISNYKRQDDSHTYSYLFAREQLKEAGIVMGLEQIIKGR